jgi:hypothetical protein
MLIAQATVEVEPYFDTVRFVPEEGLQIAIQLNILNSINTPKYTLAERIGGGSVVGILVHGGFERNNQTIS